MKPTLASLAEALAQGHTSARALVEQSLERIAAPSGEGARAFMSVAAERARAEAERIDHLRREGRAPSRFAGIPFGVKDLFDVAGEVTTAGSTVLRDAEPARDDSDAVARLRAAGFIAIGRTNMTEFAYSGLGLNPHYGTPLSVYQRDVGRIPGGSSSGSAVAVGDGMVPVALGTDTGGSCRIPAAFNGIVGYKPTASRVSRKGVFPLSASLDSVGPIANSVSCCAVLDSVLAGESQSEPQPRDISGLKVAVLSTYVLDSLDDAVAKDWEHTLGRLSAAGAKVEEFGFPALATVPNYLKNGGIVAAEAWALHADSIQQRGTEYDPRVASRMRFGANISPVELTDIKRARKDMIGVFATLSASFDAVVCPTVCFVPPTIASCRDEAEYRRINAQTLRNTYVFNFLDACAVTLPMNVTGSAPTGLMLARAGGHDQALFAAASAVEGVLSAP